jgi:hypothetical protein
VESATTAAKICNEENEAKCPVRKKRKQQYPTRKKKKKTMPT